MNDKNYLRLIATMVAEIHQKADIQGGVDSKLVASALWHKQDWAILWGSGWLLEEEDNPEEVDYVVDVLDMWRFIVVEYSRLDQPGKDRVAAEVPFGGGKEPKFPGFDGNDEGEFLGIARMLIERMGRFQEFADQDLNSHSNTTRTYRAMLDEMRKINARNEGERRHEPSADDLISLLSAPYGD